MGPDNDNQDASDQDATVSFADLRSRFESMTKTVTATATTERPTLPPKSPSNGSLFLKNGAKAATMPLSAPATSSSSQELKSGQNSGTGASIEQAPPVPLRPYTPASPELLRQRYPGAMEALAYADTDSNSLPLTPTSAVSAPPVVAPLSAPLQRTAPIAIHVNGQESIDDPPPVPERPRAPAMSSSMAADSSPHVHQIDVAMRHGTYPASAPSRSPASMYDKPLPQTSVNSDDDHPRSDQSTLSPPPNAVLPPPARRPVPVVSSSAIASRSDLPALHSTSQHSPFGSGTSSPAHFDDYDGGDLSSTDSSDIEHELATSPTGRPSNIVALRMSDTLPDGTRANRRPPHFAPPRTISTKGHNTCMAVCGTVVVTGHHDKLRVYDTHSGMETTSHQVFIDQDWREIKVNVLIFRPTNVSDDVGRYLWCGTKEGGLIEFDLRASRVTSFRANAHTACVVLLQCVGRNVISVDESGKICTWLAERGGAQHNKSGGEMDSRKAIVSLNDAPVSQRIVMDKYSVAMALEDELWVASAGEAAGASRSCKVRVYRPFSIDKPFNAVSRPIAVPDSLTGGVQIGLISSGTTIALHPNHVYLGHQTGHVSVWNRATYSCVAVYPTGTAGVTTLCGVRNWHLWLGSRKGDISIFDVREGPWEVVKRWKPYKQSPVTELLVDPSVIEKGSLQVLSASLEGEMHLWDGLLTSDWMTRELERRLTEYSSFRELKTLQITYNIDAASPLDFDGRDLPGVNFLEPEHCESAPDIIIVGFQELVDLQDTRAMAKRVLLGGARRSKGHDVGERLSHQARAWTQKIEADIRKRMMSARDDGSSGKQRSYRLLLQDSLVGLYTAVFVRESEVRNVSDTAIASIKTGFGGRMGNKGAIIASMRIDDTPIAWVNCHLAAGQHHSRERNADLVNVFESLPFSERVARMASAAADRHANGAANQDATVVESFACGGDGEMILPDHEVVFVSGDLNYRIDLRRDQCIDYVQRGNWPALLARDQLLRQLRDNNAHRLRPFSEAPITFAPTYKFDRQSSTYDTSEKQRVPAYCDRILWYTRSQNAHAVQCLTYTADTRPLPSDHRPVIGRFSFQIRKADPQRRAAILEELAIAWKVAQAERLRAAREFYFGKGAL